MRSCLLDTNVLVSFLTDRDPHQKVRAARLFDQASEGELTLGIHNLVAAEVVFVLVNVYSVPSETVARALDALLSLPGVRPVGEIPWKALFELWPGGIGGFVDAVIAAAARESGHDQVVSFDARLLRRLRKLGIPAAAPV